MTHVRNITGIFLALTILFVVIRVQAQARVTYQIDGSITWPDDGCKQGIVVLCDSKSGEPLCRQNLKPFISALTTTNESVAMDWLFAVPDVKGLFQFTNLPAGNYIVVAQAWNDPSQPTNVMGVHGETMHLLGREEVTVPSSAARRLKLSTPGTNSIQFDQQFPNDGGLLMLGTRPQLADPVLGWFGWGTNFISHLIGFNLMPSGRTTVHGLPDETYASIFANDDSPGFGATQLYFRETNRVKMPIVAGWSDGYKTPPTNLVWLVELVQTNKFNVDELLGLDSKRSADKGFVDREREKFRLLQPILEKEIALPTGQTTRVVDLLTALGYASLSGKSKN